ncbi:MAG: sulfite exporter TauE/SafE family protein [Anaerolineales bacterium]
MTTIFVGMVVFLAVFTQSLSGFGSALVSMALLPAMIGIRVATPLVAVVALVLEIVLIVRYRQALDMKSIWRVILAALVGTPLGVYFLSNVDERISLTLLGIIIAGYAVYALLGLKMPRLDQPIWAYLAGLFGGLLGGAYNTSGPPVILYADCRRWPPDMFKSNLQGYFVVSSVAVVASHTLNGNLTPQVWHMFWWTIPFIAIGLIAGLSLDRWLDPVLFRRVVLALLIVMGIRLIF